MYFEENKERIIEKIRKRYACSNLEERKTHLRIVLKRYDEDGKFANMSEEEFEKYIEHVIESENEYDAKEHFERLKDISKEIIHLVDAWLKGEYVEYQINDDINIEYIIRKIAFYRGEKIENIMIEDDMCYLAAISWANFLIRKPHMIDVFKRMDFTRE